MISRKRSIAIQELERLWGKIEVIEIYDPITFFRGLFRLLANRSRFEVVIVQEPLLMIGCAGLFISYLRRIPLISEVHGDYIQQRILPVKDRIILPIVLKKSTLVRAVNRHIESKVKHFTKSKVVYLPSVYVDLNVFNPRIKQEERDEIILFAGRLEPPKNPDLLIKAMKYAIDEHPSIKLKIIGRGSMLPTIKDLVNKLGLRKNVEIEYNWLSQEALAEEYNKASLFACVSSYEGGPRTVFEAAACMMPSVSTPVGLVPEVFRHLESVYMIPTLKPERIAEAIVIMMSDKNLRKKIAEKAYEIVVNNFEWKKTIEQYANYYLEFLKGKSINL